MAETGIGSAQLNTPFVLAPGVAVRVLNTNKTRLFAIIQNDDAANVVYVNLGMGAAVNAGIRLNATGGAVWFGRATEFPYTGEVWAISAGAARILVTEAG